MSSLLWLLILVLVVLWFAGGFVFHVAGSLIHILLVIAVVVIVFNLVQRSRGSGTRL